MPFGPCFGTEIYWNICWNRLTSKAKELGGDPLVIKTHRKWRNSPRFCLPLVQWLGGFSPSQKYAKVILKPSTRWPKCNWLLVFLDLLMGICTLAQTLRPCLQLESYSIDHIDLFGKRLGLHGKCFMTSHFRSSAPLPPHSNGQLTRTTRYA